MVELSDKTFKVRGFSYLTGGGQGEAKTQQQQHSNGRPSNGTSNVTSNGTSNGTNNGTSNGIGNGLVKSSSYGGEKRGGSTGRLGDYIRRQQQDISGNSLMSEFMNVRDTKFSSLSPSVKPR